MTAPAPLLFGRQPLTIDDVVAIAEHRQPVALDDSSDYRAAIAAGADFIDRLLREDGAVYGVTTGYGDSCTVTIPLNLVAELPLHLTRFHGCGLGALLSPAEGRAVLAARLARHTTRDWESPLLANDMEQIATLLHAAPRVALAYVKKVDVV